MANGNDLQSLRDELTRIQSQTRRSRRWAVIGFVIMLLVMCCSLLYGFVQQVEAMRQAELAMEQRKLAEIARQEADKNAEEAVKSQTVAKEMMKLAELELEKCRKSKK